MTERYQRQMAVAHIGEAGQKRLQQSHIAIVGAGGLGCPMATYLVAAGVGEITLIDHDCVSETNLHRQVLYSEHDIGKPKVACAKQRLSALNSEVVIHAVAERCTVNNQELLRNVDVIVDACDNFALTYLLSDLAHAWAKPMVSASVMQSQGYVGVYCHNTATDTACPSVRAVFPNPPMPGHDCNSVGVVGTAAGIIGMLQAQEVIKVLLADEQQLAGRLLSLDVWSYRQTIMDFTGAPEPVTTAAIITQDLIAADDIVIDVRRPEERQRTPKFSHHQMPFGDIDYQNLPIGGRLVFICASGQRALYAADKAIAHGVDDVCVGL